MWHTVLPAAQLSCRFLVLFGEPSQPAHSIDGCWAVGLEGIRIRFGSNHTTPRLGQQSQTTARQPWSILAGLSPSPAHIVASNARQLKPAARRIESHPRLTFYFPRVFAGAAPDSGSFLGLPPDSSLPRSRPNHTPDRRSVQYLADQHPTTPFIRAVAIAVIPLKVTEATTKIAIYSDLPAEVTATRLRIEAAAAAAAPRRSICVDGELGDLMITARPQLRTLRARVDEAVP